MTQNEKQASGEMTETCLVCGEGIATENEENGLLFWKCNHCEIEYVDVIQFAKNKIKYEELIGNQR